MNGATAGILAALVLAAAGAIAALRRGRKKGTGCCGDCRRCAGRCER